MSYWKNKNVFVTGAAGLLGSNLIDRLIKEGANVTGLFRDYSYQSELIKTGNAKKINIVFGNLEDYELILRALNEFEIDSVFHLGAQTIVPTANRNPLSTFNSNIKGTWNLLEACRVLGTVKRIVVASTDKAYGDQEVLPYTEDMDLNGVFPYDVSKVCADLISQSYFKSFNLPVAITRCGNIYGPGDLNFSRIVPETMQALILNKTLSIRSNGKFVRDYIFIEDVVEGNLKIAENIDKTRGEAFNLSTKNKLSVLDVVNKIFDVVGKKVKVEILDEVKNEIKNQYLSSEKASKVLGWDAKYSFEQGIKKTYPWYEKYFEVEK